MRGWAIPTATPSSSPPRKFSQRQFLPPSPD
jgi:hypothetical protein